MPAPRTIEARIGEARRRVQRTAEGDVLVDGEPVRAERLDEHAMRVETGGTSRVVVVEPQPDGGVIATVDGHRLPVALKTERDLLLERFGMAAVAGAADREVRAPMPGLVLRVTVSPGDAVEAGQGVVVLEAMKMENELKAPGAGVVAAVHAEVGAAVGKNDLLIELGDEA